MNQVLNSQQVEEETRAEAVAARGILEELRALHVESAEEIVVAGELLRDVKGEYKRLDERLKTVTRPLNDALKAARDLFRPALVALEEAEVMLKSKIGQAQLSLAESNRRAQEATQAALAGGDVRAAAEASARIATLEAPSGLSYREAWTYRIVDESKLPREFLSPDPKKIAAHVKVHGDKSPIPGVEIVRDVQVIARAK